MISETGDPALPSTTKDTDESHFLALSHGQSSIKDYVVTTARLASRDDDAFNSAAVTSLRRLTTTHSDNENTEPQILRRMSRAVSNSLKFIRAGTFGSETPKGSDDSRNVRKACMSEYQGAPSNVLQRQSTFRESRNSSSVLGTPATITLRKASNVYTPKPVVSSMNAMILNQDSRKVEPDAPASELLAFYSSPTSTFIPENIDCISSPDSDISLPHPIIEEHFNSEEARRARQRSMSISQIRKATIRRTSVVAVPTMTFTDIHVAPGTFATEVAPQHTPIDTVDPLRRISVVHFQSRDSVHEVIWREDETTSGSSQATNSRSSTSPQRPSRADTLKQDHRKSSRPHTRASKTIPPGVSSSSSTSPPLRKASDGVFHWAWNNLSTSAFTRSQSASRLNESNINVEERKSDPGSSALSSDVSAGLARNSELISVSDPDSANSQARNPTTIQSFPALLTRNTTSDWISPLADLNDPLAGRDPKAAHQGSGWTGVPRAGTRRASVVFEDAPAGEGRPGGKLVSHPTAPARVGVRGSVGSSLGMSSHRRVSRTFRV